MKTERRQEKKKNKNISRFTGRQSGARASS